jgi:hypothetical protein
MSNQEPKSKPESAEQPNGEGLSSSVLLSSLFHPGDSDRRFLMWIHDRLEHVHGENRLMDYMHKLRAIIADMPADRKTVSMGQGKNSLETLQQSIVENATSPSAPCSASFACPHCGHIGSTNPYGMNQEIHECMKCKGTWWNEYKQGRSILPNAQIHTSPH